MHFFSVLINWFSKGGVIMWPILFFSVYGTALCYERWKHYRKQEQAVSGRFEYIAAVKPDEAAVSGARFAEDTSADRLSRIVLANGGAANGARVEKVRHAFLEENARIEKHLGIISVVASLLPMLGLLGTVTGMISSFKAVALYGAGNPSVVADGISEALITTEAGLITSIPLLYLHQVLSNRADNLVRKLDEYTTHMLHTFTKEEER